jgi:hypothetical protein
MIVVFSLPTVTFLALPNQLVSNLSNRIPFSVDTTVPPVNVAMSSKMAFLRSPNSGALTATAGNNTNISSAQNMSVIVSPMRDFRVQTDADINHQSRDFVGNYMRSISLGATSDVRLYSGGSVPAATAGEISILADADLNLLSEQVINIGASGTGQPSAISFNTSGPTSPGNAITFFVANSGNDIQFPANAYLKLLGAIKDSADYIL